MLPAKNLIIFTNKLSLRGATRIAMVKVDKHVILLKFCQLNVSLLPEVCLHLSNPSILIFSFQRKKSVVTFLIFSLFIGKYRDECH